MAKDIDARFNFYSIVSLKSHTEPNLLIPCACLIAEGVSCAHPITSTLLGHRLSIMIISLIYNGFACCEQSMSSFSNQRHDLNYAVFLAILYSCMDIRTDLSCNRRSIRNMRHALPPHIPSPHRAHRVVMKFNHSSCIVQQVASLFSALMSRCWLCTGRSPPNILEHLHLVHLPRIAVRRVQVLALHLLIVHAALPFLLESDFLNRIPPVTGFLILSSEIGILLFDICQVEYAYYMQDHSIWQYRPSTFLYRVKDRHPS